MLAIPRNTDPVSDPANLAIQKHSAMIQNKRVKFLYSKPGELVQEGGSNHS